jgi:hypothetical protein
MFFFNWKRVFGLGVVIGSWISWSRVCEHKGSGGVFVRSAVDMGEMGPLVRVFQDGGRRES